jgi:hypothetical protein
MCRKEQTKMTDKPAGDASTGNSGSGSNNGGSNNGGNSGAKTTLLLVASVICIVAIAAASALFVARLVRTRKRTSRVLPPDISQIVVLKGWEGFGDRLQVLSHCLEYCKANNAALCVDWRDPMWGQGDMNFDDYFEIIDVPTVAIEDVAAYAKNGASVSPPAWTMEQIAAPPTAATHFANYDTAFDKEYSMIDADIVMMSCRGHRTYHLSNLVQNMRFTRPVAREIASGLAEVRAPYTVAHLRGTDRLKDSTLAEVVAAYEALPEHNRLRCYVISDMKPLATDFLNTHPEAKRYKREPVIYKIPATKEGTHFLSKEVLDVYGVTKRQMILESLQDFILIAFSSWDVGSSESVFLKMGKFLRQAGPEGVAKWTHGWKPERTALLPMDGDNAK